MSSFPRIVARYMGLMLVVYALLALGVALYHG